MSVGTSKTSKSTYFFNDKPIFGFDIGHGSLKVMQIDHNGKRPRITGYGSARFDPDAIENGVIIDHETIAEACLELFNSRLVGTITTRRVAVAVPSYRTFTRLITVPVLADKQLRQAVEAAAQQYIPLPHTDMYLGYSVARQDTQRMEIYMEAVPRNIVDAELEIMRLLGLETVGVQTTIDATSRLFLEDPQSDVPAVLIDFGSLSADISIFNRTKLISSKVPVGGEIFTDRIQHKLKVTHSEAQLIKTRYGLGASKKQSEIKAVLDPLLTHVAQEIQRMIRYYDQNYGSERPISQVITMGGGANMPGLTDYLTDSLRLAVRACDPWKYCDTHDLLLPSKVDKSMFSTVMGLSLASPRELF